MDGTYHLPFVRNVDDRFCPVPRIPHALRDVASNEQFDAISHADAHRQRQPLLLRRPHLAVRVYKTWGRTRSISHDSQRKSLIALQNQNWFSGILVDFGYWPIPCVFSRLDHCQLQVRPEARQMGLMGKPLAARTRGKGQTTVVAGFASRSLPAGVLHGQVRLPFATNRIG